MNIKIKKITVENEYDITLYDGPGAYETQNGNLIFVGKDNFVWNIGLIDQFPFLVNNEKETKENNTISEDFALNMLNVAINGKKL